MNRRNFFEHYEDFFGHGSLPIVAAANDARSAGPYFVTVTGNNCTYAHQTNTSSGNLLLKLADNEVQNLCMSWNDALCLDARQRLVFEARVSTNQAAIDNTTQITFGFASARNNTIGSIVTGAFFTNSGDHASNNVDYLYCESDDNVTDTAPVNTGVSFVNTYKTFQIDAQDLTSVKFYVDGQRVNKQTTYKWDALTSTTRYVQPFFQIQKASDSNTDGLLIDYVYVTGRRNY